MPNQHYESCGLPRQRAGFMTLTAALPSHLTLVIGWVSENPGIAPPPRLQRGAILDNLHMGNHHRPPSPLLLSRERLPDEAKLAGYYRQPRATREYAVQNQLEQKQKKRLPTFSEGSVVSMSSTA